MESLVSVQPTAEPTVRRLLALNKEIVTFSVYITCGHIHLSGAVQHLYIVPHTWGHEGE